MGEVFTQSVLSGRKGWRAVYLGSLIGLQRQELGHLQSSGNLAEC